jgi:hypothetical protein
MKRDFIPGCTAMLLVCIWTISPGRADTIFVPNGSFESPATTYVSVNIDSWQKSAKPDSYQESGGFLWTQLTGIFKNSDTNMADHIDNCDGSQALWLFADPEVGLFQDYDSIDWHNQPPNHQFDALFKPGKAYSLLVGVIGTGGGMLQGATLDLSLYYRDATSNKVMVSVTTLTNLPDVFSNNTHFVDCKVSVPPVKPSDAWANQHIGIQFKSTVTTNLQGGYWDLDNARLVEIAPPVLAGPGWTNGQFSFTVVSDPGSAFQIQALTNLSLLSTDWATIGFLTNNTGSNVFSTSLIGGSAFYRARRLQ